MIDERTLGLVLVLVGAVGIAVSALADALGIGEGDVFGWLQIAGVVIGGIATRLGLALAMEWVPVARRQASASSASGPQTTVIEGSKRTP
jgi:hypothetical protein